MSWGYEKGKVYNRRADIHRLYGGQQQGGMITPANYPLVILITGDEGKQHGYLDHWEADGSFRYFGHGQVGDMQLRDRNLRLAESGRDGKSVLLFQTTKAGLRFVDEMVYDSHEIVRERDREQGERDAIVFKLWPLSALAEQPPPAQGHKTAPGELAELRKRALAAAGPVLTSESRRTVYERSADVAAYVLARASGKCEGCRQPAPFNRRDGSAYLEPHHTIRVSDGGPDHPSHVIALCPNCHRRVHAGADGETYNAALIAWVEGYERSIEA